VINEVKQTKIYKRYYHVFVEGELENLVQEVQGVTLVKSYFDHANWAVIIQKN
jgi:hypothetical protein